MEHPTIRGLGSWRLLAADRHAVVWQARQPALDRAVAVKVYVGALDEDARQEFLGVTARAARLAAHRGAVTVHDAGVLPDGRAYVVEELGTGGSVAAWLERSERPAPERVREVGAVIADALAAAHAAGVRHGGVRPTNILIDGYGAPVLVDFGAAVVHEAQRHELSAEESGYAPPEARAGAPATAAGDVYSLAATLYALLSGRPPPDLTGRAARTRASRGAVPLWDVDAALRALLLAALDEDPTARPSAADLRDGLLRHPGPAAAAPVAARSADPAGRAEPRTPTSRRRRVLLAVAALALVGSTGAWLLGDRASSSPPASTAPALPSPEPPSPEPSASGDGSASAGSASPGAVRIELAEPTGTAEPFEAVPLSGTYSGGSRTTFLRVQRWERGAWRTFPLPTRPDRAGRFTTHVELGQPGRYPLRVLDPESGASSEPVLLVVRA